MNYMYMYHQLPITSTPSTSKYMYISRPLQVLVRIVLKRIFLLVCDNSVLACLSTYFDVVLCSGKFYRLLPHSLPSQESCYMKQDIIKVYVLVLIQDTDMILAVQV